MNDEQTIDRLVKDNEALVYFVWRKLIMKNAEIRRNEEDIIQNGRIGLFFAAKGYDESKKTTFSTYAVDMIKHFMLRYIVSKKHGLGIRYDILPTVSLDSTNSCGVSWREGLIDETDYFADKPSDRIEDVQDPYYVKFLGTLEPRDYKLLSLRMKGLTWKEIGSQYGVSKQCVQRHFDRVVEKYNKYISENR